jgi:hypothetical protein
MQSDVNEVTTPKLRYEPPLFQKKVGSTVYQIYVHFNKAGTETIDDKILHMIKSEVCESA